MVKLFIPARKYEYIKPRKMTPEQLHKQWPHFFDEEGNKRELSPEDEAIFQKVVEHNRQGRVYFTTGVPPKLPGIGDKIICDIDWTPDCGREPNHTLKGRIIGINDTSDTVQVRLTGTIPRIVPVYPEAIKMDI